MSGVTGDALELRVTRLLGVLRLCAVGFELAVMCARPAWYFSPAHVVVPSVAAAWGVVFAVGCLRLRRLPRWLAVGEAAVGVLLAVAVTVSVPPPELAGGPNWVALRLIGSTITLVWCVPASLWLPYVLGLATTVVAATRVLGGVAVESSLPPMISVVVVTVLFAVVAARLRAGARTTDAWLATSAERERSLAVTAARLRDLRESERLVHDTVLNTLTGLSWGAFDTADDDVRARCRRDVAHCEELLGGTDDNDETLLARLARVADDARADGLTVSVSVSGDGDVPTDVAAAFAAAVGEALSNVRRHARTRRARVVVRVESDGARIDVTDEGPGFAPDAVDADRLGIRRSIVERMNDVGGATEVRSAPGRPTTVTLHWAAHAAVVDNPAETADVEAAYVRDAVRAVGVAVLLWQAFLGAVLVGRWGRYTHPEVVFGVWALTSTALAGYVRMSLRPRLRQSLRQSLRGTGRRAVPSPLGAAARAVARARAVAGAGVVVAALAGQVAAGLTGERPDPIPLNWAMLSTYGVVAFLTVAIPTRHWLPASLLVGAGSVAVSWYYLGPVADVVTYVGIYLYLQAVVQLVTSGIGPLRRQTAQATARAARAEAERAADLRVAATVRRDRRDRLRRLRAEALPLLSAVGAGQLDPSSLDVRRRCRACATTLRRTMHERYGADTLLGGLETAVRAAETRGATVVTQVAGAVDDLPEPGRSEVVRAVSEVLDGIEDGQVVLTVTGDAAAGSAFVTFPQPSGTSALGPTPAHSKQTPAPPQAPQPHGRVAAVAAGTANGGGWIEVDEDRTDGEVSVEVRWRTPRS